MIGGLNEGARQTTFCASGQHHEGTCLCDSNFLSEESGTLLSISRIIMLAEALYEVDTWDSLFLHYIRLYLVVSAIEVTLW